MNFKICAICGLTLPLSMVKPIMIKNKGRIIKVAICNICEEKKLKKH